MLAPATFRERLPSAVAAIALQAGLLALLLLSFQVVRHIGEEKEHFITLPPPVQPVRQNKPAPAPGRNPAIATPAPPAAAAPPPAWASPGFALGSGAGAGIRLARPPGLNDCKPENYANLNASDRKACSHPEDLARHDPNAVPLNPGKPVRNAPVWQGEMARRNAPAVIPGGNPLGAAFNLLFNPGAFLDPRNYSYAAPGNGGDDSYDGAEATHRLWSQPPQCPAGMDDSMRKTCEANAAAVYKLKFATSGAPGPALPHVSDADFQKARAAVQARQQSLYAPPVLASGTSKRGGNAQTDRAESNTGTRDAPAVAPGGAGR
jgi:hypothetical protein